MVKAQLLVSISDKEHDEPVWDTAAEITVEDDGSHHGDHVERFGLQKAVLDPEARESVRFDEDPIRWLRWLPGSYRTGDVIVNIVHDDDPPASITTGDMAVGA